MQHSNVEPQTVETVEPQTVEPRTVEPRTVEPRTVEPRTVEPQTVEPRTVEPGETLAAYSPARALVRRSPFDGLAGRDLTTRGVVLLGALAAGSFAALEATLTDDLGRAFGVFFVLVSVTCALAAGPSALFAPGVLPPLLMVAVLAAVAILAPSAIDVDGLAASAGVVQRVIAGLIDHATALVVAHVLALVVVGLRIWSAPARRLPA